MTAHAAIELDTTPPQLTATAERVDDDTILLHLSSSSADIAQVSIDGGAWQPFAELWEVTSTSSSVEVAVRDDVWNEAAIEVAIGTPGKPLPSPTHLLYGQIHEPEHVDRSLPSSRLHLRSEWRIHRVDRVEDALVVRPSPSRLRRRGVIRIQRSHPSAASILALRSSSRLSASVAGELTIRSISTARPAAQIQAGSALASRSTWSPSRRGRGDEEELLELGIL